MPQSKFLFIGFTLLVLLGIRFFFFLTQAPHYTDGQRLTLNVQLQEDSQQRGNAQQFSIKDAWYQTITVKTVSFPRYHYGQALQISGKLKVSSYHGKAFYTLSYPQITVSEENQNSFTGLARYIRENSNEVFENTLPSTSSSLLLGIVFGTKQQFPDDFSQHLRIVGVLHVIAASGMNVSFVAGAVLFSLSTFLRRQIAIGIAVFAVIFYSFLVGFEPSILRAAIMATIAFTASLFGRQSLTLFTVFTTIVAMLLWQPGFLFNVGFQLSFLSTLGIVYIKPPLDRTLSSFGKIGYFLGQDITTTTAAQIGTLPVMFSVFGSYGILSVLVNALVLGTVPILMILGSLAVVAGLLFAPLAKVFLFLSLPFLLFFEKVIDFFGEGGWTLTVSTFPWPFVVAYYLLLIAGIIFIKSKREKE